MPGIRIVAILLQVPILILFPIGVGLLLHCWLHVPWKVFFTGVLSYICAVSLLLPFTILFRNEYASQTSWQLVFWISFPSPLAEETMRYLSFRVVPIMRRYRTWDGALMAGAGHGGAEMMAIGLFFLAALLAYLLVPLNPQVKQYLSQYFSSFPLWALLLAGLLRVAGILCQIGFATLSTLAYRRSFLFYPLAIGAHFLVNFLTFGVAMWSLLWSELLVQVFGLLVLAFVLAMRRSKTLAATI